MNSNKKTLLLAVISLVILLTGAYWLYGSLEPAQASIHLAVDKTSASREQIPETTAPAVTAPDFTVYDRDGNPVSLSDFFGKPIVLNFWASWCGPCKMEMPDFHEKYLELGNEIHFLMINMTDGSRETVDSASKFIAEQEYTFPVFYDTESDASAAYGVYSLPTTFFIDAEGHAIAQATGAINMDTLEKGITMISQK